ncbi:hypothetical protein GCM10011397_14050 [Wenyingzhuangia marina]|nr:hypothetical protein GCM10011397_14050 [Wenyingzhuangia marina]
MAKNDYYHGLDNFIMRTEFVSKIKAYSFLINKNLHILKVNFCTIN